MTHPQTEAKGADAKAAAMDAVGEVWMTSMDSALRVTDQLQADADLQSVRVFDGGEIFAVGDTITEIWDAHGRSVTRTFMGEYGKLHREAIDPDEFYA